MLVPVLPVTAWWELEEPCVNMASPRCCWGCLSISSEIREDLCPESICSLHTVYLVSARSQGWWFGLQPNFGNNLFL